MVFFPSSGYDNFWSNYMHLADNKFINNGAYCKFADDEGKSLYDKSWRLKDAKTTYETDRAFKETFDLVLKKALRGLITQLKANKAKSLDEELNLEVE